MRKSVFYAIGAAVLLWTAVAFSCTSEQAAPDRLPEVPVHVHLSKADARYKELWQPGGIAIIDRPQVAGEAVGVAAYRHSIHNTPRCILCLRPRLPQQF